MGRECGEWGEWRDCEAASLLGWGAFGWISGGVARGLLNPRLVAGIPPGWTALRDERIIDLSLSRASLSRCKMLAVESIQPKCLCCGKPMGLWRFIPRLPGWLRANRGLPMGKRTESASASVIN
jgi:hypothetical protein